jgi:superfamily I DNA/RNA helicase/mRNA-degrading endonuclease RelE of RelBE toxin-antitoxin system
MYDILLSQQFQSDLDSLDKAIRERVPKTVRLIEQDPKYKGLETHPHNIKGDRKILRSRVNYNYRILWEWLDGGRIGLWRVGKHDFVDAFHELPGVDETSWESNQQAEAQDMSQDTYDDWRQYLEQPQPFEHFPVNHLRLFGVPDEFIDDVRSLSEPEKIWEMSIPENVQYTLYGILLQGDDWTADAFLDTQQFLYRTTVDQLEGYCEGKLKRLLLNLTDEQMALVRISATGPILIKGVAGSGKTTIGLYRAQYLIETLEEQRRMFGEKTSILLLTFSRTLANALEQLYVELYGDIPYNITVQTYSRWMMSQLAKVYKYTVSVDKQNNVDHRIPLIEQALQEVKQRYPDDTLVTEKPVKFFLEEIDDVIRARNLERLEDYLLINRVGRGTGLSREQHRPILWEIYERYQQLLDEKNLVDFADLPRLVMSKCQNLPKYDVVIIDEAQDLPPSYLQLASQLIESYEASRTLTLLADPAQSIYYRGVSWKEGGINVRGNRTRTLSKNFRNTQQILNAAKPILEQCDDLKTADEYFDPTSTHRLGPKPIVASYETQEQAMNYLVSTLIALCQSQNYRPSDIAILARNDDEWLSNLRKLLSKEDLPWAHFRRDFKILENEVKLITMHSAKGLEFPVVFMVNLADGVIPFIRSAETEEADLLQERKLFYVSMTRASERLYLLHPKRNRSRFLYDLDDATINPTSC